MLTGGDHNVHRRARITQSLLQMCIDPHFMVHVGNPLTLTYLEVSCLSGPSGLSEESLTQSLDHILYPSPSLHRDAPLTLDLCCPYLKQTAQYGCTKSQDRLHKLEICIHMSQPFLPALQEAQIPERVGVVRCMATSCACLFHLQKTEELRE